MSKSLKFNDPKTVVAVVRVSGKEQELSPEAQAHGIQEYCQAHGLTLLAVFLERVTSVAPLEERYGLQGALASLRGLDAGVLMFFDRDRISRDVLLTKLIEREAVMQGAVVATVTGTNGTSAHDDFMKTVLDAAAEYERARLIQRTRDALAAKKRRGEYVGGLPYGYSWQDGTLVPNEQEQAVIQAVRRMKEEEGMSYRMISRRLEATSRRGTPFSKTQLIRMLQP